MAQVEQEDDSSPPTTTMVFGHLTIQTMDNMKVNYGIESMIDETNLDKKHGRMKNTPKSYEAAKKDKFQVFCNTIYSVNQQDTTKVKQEWCTMLS